MRSRRHHARLLQRVAVGLHEHRAEVARRALQRMRGAFHLVEVALGHALLDRCQLAGGVVQEHGDQVDQQLRIPVVAKREQLVDDFLIDDFLKDVTSFSAEVEQPIQIQIRLFNERQTLEVQHFAVYMNSQEPEVDKNSDTYIISDKTKPLEIVHPNGFFEKVEFLLNVLLVGKICNLFTVGIWIFFFKPVDFIIRDVSQKSRIPKYHTVSLDSYCGA